MAWLQFPAFGGKWMKVLFLFIAVLIMTYFAGKWLSHRNTIDIKPHNVNSSSCDPSKTSCEVTAGNISYFLDFKGKPSALVPFTVNIGVPGNQPQTIELAFEMVGMEMGFNQYYLIQNNDNWSAEVILPICSLGRDDWVLSVKINFKEIETITKFEFSQTTK